MAYQPFLIAPFGTGLDTDSALWLRPVDAFSDIENGHIHHGYVEKREGYRFLGEMVHGREITAATNANPAVFTVTSATGLSDGDTVTLHYLSGGTWANINGAKYTIDNLSGTNFELLDSTGTAVDGTSLGTYTANSGRLGTFEGLRIMGIFRYIGSDNSRELLIADTERIAIYNPGINLFEPLDLVDAAATTIYTDNDVFDGSNLDYIWAANWQNPGVNNRVYITNGKAYDGSGAAPGTDGIVYYDASIASPPAGLVVPPIRQFQPSLGGSNVLYGCKMIFSIKQRLLTLHTFEFNGSNTITFPQRARWCAAQNPGNWDDTTPGGGGFVDAPTGEQIISARSIQDIIIVEFTDSVWTIRPVPDPALPFRWDKINDFRSCDGRMASVAYDRYVVAVGQRGITATDGVETRRVDERIQDFATEVIDDDWFGKVFAARSYANTRTWILYPEKEQNAGDGEVDAKSALIYDDNSGSYSRYSFSDGNMVNVLGYGGTAIDYAAEDFIAANDLDKAAEDFNDETAFSFYWSQNSEIFLGGDRVGNIYIMETEGSDNGGSIEFKLYSAGWNPYKDQGIEAQLGYVDFYCDSDQQTKLEVFFYKNDNETHYESQGIDLLPDLGFISEISNVELTNAGDPTQGLTVYSGKHGLSTGKQVYFYGIEGMTQANNKQFLVTVIDGDTFTVDVDATDFGSYTAGGQIFERKFYRTKVWKRAYGGGIGYVHQIRIESEGADRPLKIHAFKPWFRPRGRRTLG